MLYFFTIFIMGSMLVPETEAWFNPFKAIADVAGAGLNLAGGVAGAGLNIVGGVAKGVHTGVSAVLGGASHAVTGTLGGVNDVSEALFGWGEMNEAQREEAVEKMLAQE